MVTVMDAAPAVAVIVGEPHPEEEAVAGFATVMALGVVGSVSEKFNPLIATGAELVRVKMREEIPPAVVGEGLNVFETFTALAGSII